MKPEISFTGLINPLICGKRSISVPINRKTVPNTFLSSSSVFLGDGIDTIITKTFQDLF